MNQEAMNYISQLETQIQAQEAQKTQMSQSMATMFSKDDNANLVKWQIDIAEELERIEHLLKKHIPKTDEKSGQMYWAEPAKEDKLFNEYGVQEILNILAWYLNKNIILSRFDAEEINIRMNQFSSELIDFIFTNYEKFGLDDKEKIKHFPMVVMNIVNTVEAAYHRALEGGERNSLRTARTVHQTEGVAMGMPGQGQEQKKFNILKPTTWTR